jgi:tight adherence protein C
MVLLIALSVFGVVTLVLVAGFYAVTAESQVERRVRALVPKDAGDAGRIPSTARSEPGVVSRVVASVGQYGIARGDSNTSQRLSAAGFRSPNASRLFLGARTILSFGPALIVLVPQISSGQPIAKSLLLAALGWAIGHSGANLWLRWRVNRRTRELSDALPDALDLMVTCLEAGLGLAATIARVGEERSAMHDVLGRELSQVSIELRSGRSREEALRALGQRNGVEDLKSLAALIIQSDRLGASIAKTLRVHSDMVRTKRRQRAEEAVRKLPIKVLFPLAILLLPPLFIVVTGPAVLKFSDLVNVVTER